MPTHVMPAKWLPCLILATAYCCPQKAEGSEVAYSWTGTIVKEASEDPWLIGEAGKPFSISITVDRMAHEAFSATSVSNADFLPLSIAFSIDGVNASQIVTDQYDTIQFWDNLFSGSLDQISVPFIAEFNGVASHLLSAVRLPTSTFAFTLEQESPPTFGSAITSQFSRGGRGSLYGLSSPAGTEVAAVLVPEPGAFVLIWWAIAFVVDRSFR